jgi:hypothetical protein
VAHGVSPAATRHRGRTSGQAHLPRPGGKTRVLVVNRGHGDDERGVGQAAQT